MANKKTFGTRTNLSASGTGLGSKVRTNFNYFNSLSFSFVFDEVLQLVETPTIKPEVKSLAFPDFSYSFDILQYNSSSITVANNLFADVVVYPSLETSFPTRNFFEKFPSRVSAFGLKFCPQSLEFEPIGFNFIPAKKLPIACYSNMVYSDINTNLKSVRNLVDVNVSGKCYIEEEPAFLVKSQESSLVAPRKIFEIIVWDVYRNIYPFLNCGKPDVIFSKCKSPLIESQRHKFLKLRFFAFIGFNRFKSLGSYSIGIYNELRRQFKAFSCFIITKMMKLVSIAYFGFKSLISNVLNSFRILLHSFDKKFVFRDFQLDGGYGLHNYLKDKVVYKPYVHMSNGGWQFLPRLKLWVSLPYNL